MPTALDALRRPAYTGDRRCWPCTVLNVGLLAVCVGVVALVGLPVLAFGVGVFGLVAIALRGYVVPYTPRFAPRLAARLPGDRFHATDTPGTQTPTATDSLSGDVSADRVLDALVEAGVLVADGEELSLEEGFRERWRDEMATVRTHSSRALAETVLKTVPAADDAELVDVDGEDWVVLSVQTNAVAGERWLSRPVAIAEVAAVRTLEDLPLETRLAAARPLRLFLDTCPVCESPVEETTTAACCGGHSHSPDAVLACPACEARLFTFPS